MATSHAPLRSDGRLLVNLDEAAGALSLSRRSVQALIYTGELPSVKVGRCRRIPTADLEAYVERLRQEQNDREGQRLAVVGGSRDSGRSRAV